MSNLADLYIWSSIHNILLLLLIHLDFLLVTLNFLFKLVIMSTNFYQTTHNLFVSLLQLLMCFSFLLYFFSHFFDLLFNFNVVVLKIWLFLWNLSLQKIDLIFKYSDLLEIHFFFHLEFCLEGLDLMFKFWELILSYLSDLIFFVLKLATVINLQLFYFLFKLFVRLL